VEWQAADVVGIRDETPTARTLTLRVPGWPGFVAGQHIDIRLTAPDGYQAARSYSISSSARSDTVEVSVELLDDGEVSPYLVRYVGVGDQLEVVGPLGGWFVWRPEQTEPIRLIGGGSGVAPLMSILRTHADAGSPTSVRLLYSVRSPEFLYYRDEIRRLVESDLAEVDIQYTRQAPEGWAGTLGRLDPARVTAWAAQSPAETLSYICGPTRFVELAADALVASGIDPLSIKTERFGGA
jgi:ferredoxin-NADP reductase